MFKPLSQSCKQRFLLLADLPFMVNLKTQYCPLCFTRLCGYFDFYGNEASIDRRAQCIMGNTGSLSDVNYQLTYSESYSGLLNGAPHIIADFPYVTSLLAAFNSFLMDNYHAFVLTVETYTVAIYCTVDLMRYKEKRFI